MKACTLTSQQPVEDRPLVLNDIPVPAPSGEELLVRVHACGICRTDLHVVEGDLPLRRSPLVPGHQIVGRVVARGPEAGGPEAGGPEAGGPEAGGPEAGGPEGGGPDAGGIAVGDRVGIAWLRRTCGACRFCRTGRENLCESPGFTGWTADGGLAEYATVPSSFAYPLPEGFDDIQAAPLLCAGIIGYRALRMTGLDADGQGWGGARLGIYGFGAAGHVAIQLARSRGAEVYVMTRDRARHQSLAAELGAAWIGDARDAPPVRLDAAIVFAPAGELVPVGLKALDKGGVLVLGGIHMSPIPSFEYPLIYGERVIRSVANNTREDGLRFLEEAARIPVRTHVRTFGLEETNDALIALKNDAIRGAGVVIVDENGIDR